MNLALFASGEGTNALKLLEAARGLKNIRIPLVIVDQPTSKLPNKVRELYPNVEVKLIARTGTRDEHESQILTELKAHDIQWCFLAGYMRVLGSTFLNGMKNANGKIQIVNIHPSLLPKFPGLDSYRRTFESSDLEGGVTVHWVNAGVDTGPIIAQRSFSKLPNDTLHDFVERGKKIEWVIYPEVLRALNDHGHLDGIKL